MSHILNYKEFNIITHNLEDYLECIILYYKHKYKFEFIFNNKSPKYKRDIDSSDFKKIIKLLRNVNSKKLNSEITNNDNNKLKDLNLLIKNDNFFNFKGIFIRKKKEKLEYKYLNLIDIDEITALKYMKCFKSWEDIQTLLEIKLLTDV